MQTHNSSGLTRDEALPLVTVGRVANTNEALRQRALRLVAHGVSQKVLAAKMGMQPSSFSRWLRQKDGVGPASVAALDGFNAYVLELLNALSDDPGAVTRTSAPPHRPPNPSAHSKPRRATPEAQETALKKRGRSV